MSVVTRCLSLAKSIGMARARKKPEERKDYHLRVPLSADQRALIEKAVTLEGTEKAGWARATLLTAARKRIAKSDGEK
jgi:uncharacterized protein (DUF1778 family)